MWNQIQKLASAIYNDIVGGLRGYHTNFSISMEQLEQDIVDERLQVIKEYSIKGILPVKDLYISINCIPIDCKDIERCRCNSSIDLTPTAHFEIPQVLNDYGLKAIDYIGASDRQLPFIYYTSAQALRLHKYRKRGKDRPYVWIDSSPNENGMNDCFIFNAPLLKSISITAIFKDPRQLQELSNCASCNILSDNNISFIDNEIKKRLTLKKINFYRVQSPNNMPNDQQYTAG